MYLLMNTFIVGVKINLIMYSESENNFISKGHSLPSDVHGIKRKKNHSGKGIEN
jgi:hypothetical protein